MFIVKRVYIKIEISCLSFKNLDHLEAVDLCFHMTTKSGTGKWLPLWLAHELSWSWYPPSPFLTFQTHVSGLCKNLKLQSEACVSSSIM